jgi:hypothetical protein
MLRAIPQYGLAHLDSRRERPLRRALTRMTKTKKQSQKPLRVKNETPKRAPPDLKVYPTRH